MFDESGMVVKAWVRLIESGSKTMDDVPALFNLQETVAAALSTQ